ncbi:ankyrin repeat-containing protein At5g02620 [Ziziphus jujuba]|uniref:Ankyrin repeat-containing protein At5g02620 n=1 Tax=Ziziphus jujuba TaxID=326968 RepID=A0ABM3IHG5_ZIZJJ|nr:ankyrin repeat-containing protein At5g02620 [Ziziphus jujuba]
MSALHISAKQGHVNVMEQIISHKPDACDLVDNRGWNLLHVAVANATLNVVRFILKTPRLESLINATDNEGNTPLHVDAGRDKYRIITILVNEIKVHKKAQNHNFQKPIDLIRTNPNIGELYKSMIAMRLEKQGGQPSLRSLVHKEEYRKPIKKDIIINRVGANRDKDHDHTSKEVGYDQDKDVKSNRLKNISTIHLLVATLIATVTFTAGFTMPGGFEQNESSRKGLALLSDNTYFHLFVIADSLAFYCSSASVFLQFCAASEHNYHLLLRFTKVSATLTYISSLGMVVAFTSALHAVMPGSSMLAYYTFVSEINAHNPDGCDLVDNREWTPIHAAITNKKLNVVRYILKRRMLESLIHAADNKGNMPLHVATGRDKYSIITILVNYLKVHKKANNLNFKNIID